MIFNTLSANHRSLAVWFLLACLGCGVQSTAGLEIPIDVSAIPIALQTTQASQDGEAWHPFAQGWVNIAEVRLIPCEESSSATKPRWLQKLKTSLKFLPSAYAHGATTPLSIANTHIIRLDIAHPSTHIGTLRPPPGHYCYVEWILGPTDADAAGLDLVRDPSQAIGQTMRLDPDPTTLDAPIVRTQRISAQKPLISSNNDGVGLWLDSSSNLSLKLQLSFPSTYTPSLWHTLANNSDWPKELVWTAQLIPK